MSLPVTIRRVARSEIKEAHDWYEGRRKGLGERFLDAVKDTIRRVGQTPEMHQIIYRDVRHSLVPGFPYAVYYRVLKAKVVVVGVCHSSRNPETWQSRN
jgi:plasmid stabilization system protein ParE